MVTTMHSITATIATNRQKSASTRIAQDRLSRQPSYGDRISVIQQEYELYLKLRRNEETKFEAEQHREKALADAKLLLCSPETENPADRLFSLQGEVTRICQVSFQNKGLQEVLLLSYQRMARRLAQHMVMMEQGKKPLADSWYQMADHGVLTGNFEEKALGEFDLLQVANRGGSFVQLALKVENYARIWQNEAGWTLSVTRRDPLNKVLVQQNLRVNPEELHDLLAKATIASSIIDAPYFFQNGGKLPNMGRRGEGSRVTSDNWNGVTFVTEEFEVTDYTDSDQPQSYLMPKLRIAMPTEAYCHLMQAPAMGRQGLADDEGFLGMLARAQAVAFDDLGHVAANGAERDWLRYHIRRERDALVNPGYAQRGLPNGYTEEDFASFEAFNARRDAIFNARRSKQTQNAQGVDFKARLKQAQNTQEVNVVEVEDEEALSTAAMAEIDEQAWEDAYQALDEAF